MVEEIAFMVNVFYFVYDLIRQGIEYLLSITLYQANPVYAEKYADAISMLIPVTALWLVLEFVEGFRRFLKFIVLVGWVLVLVSIGITLI
ncbi:MAG: hypothetical protein B6U72_02335 [Candidatus Altiarchaeales archaeon ex4484_2]|nr:MAG: hypothetical protein B6U72_02335 [Candidatus Altiarchaeales archaeon ex4484_2]